MSTIAGGGTMLVHLARRGETIALDFNVQAPAACARELLRAGRGRGAGPLPVARAWWATPTSSARKSVAIPGLGGRALPGARAVRHDGPGRRGGARDPRSPRRASRSDWYLALDHRAALRRARRLPRDRAHLPARRPLRVPAGLERSPRRRAAPARPGPQPAAHRQGRPGGVLPRRDRPGHPRGDAAQRRLPDRGATSPATRRAWLEPADHGGYRGLELAFSPGATGGTTAARDAEHPRRSSRPRRSGTRRRAGSTCAPRPSATPSSTGCATWAIRSRSRAPWRRAGLERARPARSAAGLRAAGPRSDAKAAGRPWAHDAASRRRRARGDGGGAGPRGGCPPTATTAPPTSARSTASATWSRSPTPRSRSSARGWWCRAPASCSRTA